MINLLPDNDRKIIRAARQNTSLLKYVFLLALIFVATGAIFGYGFYASRTEKLQAQAELAEEQDKATKYKDIKAQADEFAKNLASAKAVLGNGVVYSEFLLKLAEVVPSGTVINNFALTQSTFGTPVTLNGQAKSERLVTQLQSSLEESDIFEKVSIETVQQSDASDDTNDGGETSGGSSSTSSEYPVTFTLKATLSKPVTN